MERLSFFGDYPIRQVEDFNVSRSGDRFFLKCLRYMGDHPSFPQEEVVFRKGLPRGDLFWISVARSGGRSIRSS
jgi:hypothetical protein